MMVEVDLKGLFKMCTCLLDEFDRDSEGNKEARELIRQLSILPHSSQTFVIEVFLGCVAHSAFLDHCLQRYKHLHITYMPSDHNLYKVICYLASLRGEEVGLDLLQAIITSIDRSSILSRFVNFFFDAENLKICKDFLEEDCYWRLKRNNRREKKEMRREEDGGEKDGEGDGGEGDGGEGDGGEGDGGKGGDMKDEEDIEDFERNLFDLWIRTSKALESGKKSGKKEIGKEKKALNTAKKLAKLAFEKEVLKPLMVKDCRVKNRVFKKNSVAPSLNVWLSFMKGGLPGLELPVIDEDEEEKEDEDVDDDEDGSDDYDSQKIKIEKDINKDKRSKMKMNNKTTNNNNKNNTTNTPNNNNNNNPITNFTISNLKTNFLPPHGTTTTITNIPPPRPVKMTTASILREGTLYKKKQEEMLKKITEWEKGGVNEGDYDGWKRKVEEEEEERKKENVQVLKLQCLLTHEQSLLARKVNAKEKKRRVAEMKEEAASLMNEILLKKMELEEQNRGKVNKVTSMKLDSKEAVKKNHTMKTQAVKKMQNDLQKMWQRVLQEAEEEMKQKMELIRQIRSMEGNWKRSGRKSAQESPCALLVAMTTQDLKERLKKMKEEKEEWLKEKRREIKDEKEGKEDMLRETLQLISEQRNKIANEACLRAAVKKNALEVSTPKASSPSSRNKENKKSEMIRKMEKKIIELRKQRMEVDDKGDYNIINNKDNNKSYNKKEVFHKVYVERKIVNA